MLLNKRRNSAFDIYVFIILIALELLMSFTFLGYIHMPPISVSLAFIPVIVSACLLGTAESTAIGFVCGLASMYKSTASYVMPADMVFSPFLSGNPFGSIITAVGTRALFGLITGLMFSVVKNRGKFRLWTAVITAVASKLHSFIVYCAMGAFFPNVGYSYLNGIHFRWGDFALAIICVCIVEVCLAIYNSRGVNSFKLGVNESKAIPYANTKTKKRFFVLFAIFILLMTIFGSVYFSQRASYMLTRHGIEVSSDISGDVMHLQIQFMMAMLSINIITLIIVLSVYRYTMYQRFLGEFDTVTRIMGRGIFLKFCEEKQNKFKHGSNEKGWFLFLDVDNFKTINDTLGHSVGDNVLEDVAAIMKEIFCDCGLFGRMGGDEFAAMIDQSLVSKDELIKRLDLFLSKVAQILSDKHIVSCSIGVCEFGYPTDMSRLLKETDKILYDVKRRGRNGYEFGKIGN